MIAGLINFLFILAAGVVMTATLAGFLGRWWWVFELFSHFRVQYCWSLALLAAIFVLRGQWGWAIPSALLALVNLGLIVPLYDRKSGQVGEGHQLRLALANVRTANPHHDRARKWFQETNPDFIALVEVDDAWLQDLDLVSLGYGHVLAVPRGDNYGLALYSRYPLENAHIQYFERQSRPSLVSQARIGGTPLNLLVSHPPPPKSCEMAKSRDAQIMAIMEYIQGLEGPVLFCGDLNTTSWSPAYAAQLARGKLVDSRQGFGVQPTWPAWMPFLRVPLDHIWCSHEVWVRHRQVGFQNGSDHLPVLLDFAI